MASAGFLRTHATPVSTTQHRFPRVGIKLAEDPDQLPEPEPMRQTAVAATLLAAIVTTAFAQPCEWQHVLTPPLPNASANPIAVDASAPDDVWMVGEQFVGTLPHWEFHNFIAHFDGQSWTNIPLPSLDPDGHHNELTGVVALSKDNAFAAGTTLYPGGQQIQIFHWNGATWSLDALNLVGGIATAESLGLAGHDLWLMSHSANDADPPATSGIASGFRREQGDWNRYPVPPLAAFGRSRNLLHAVDGIAEDDAWAVGAASQVYTPGPSFGPVRYIVHWNGSEWTLDQSLPFDLLELSSLNDVAAIAADDAWAVGYETGNGTNQPMILHYDGSGWSRIDLEPLPHAGGLLRALAAVSADEIYALGARSDEHGNTHALIYQWDGSAWSRMEPALSGGAGDQFMAATAVPGGGVWGVGLYVRPGSGPYAQRLNCHPLCPSDLTGSSDPNDPNYGIPNGVADSDDFFYYLDAFVSQTLPVCDVTGSSDPNDPTYDIPNGVCDGDDFFRFLDLFVAGCP